MNNGGTILAIDPGPAESAFVLLAGDRLREFGKVRSVELLERLPGLRRRADHLAVEMVACFGMPVGRDVFETACFIGRFIQAWAGPYNKVLRKGRWGPDAETIGAAGRFDGVCMNICRNNRAKDGNVRQAIIDRYPATGGGKVPQVGTKAKPGPLYGVSKDVWAALAVGLTWQDQAGRAAFAEGGNVG